jgi:hypothetical protein
MGSESLLSVRKKVTETHDFISTAYHEAGHVVYGLLHFVMIKSAVVFINKKNKRVEGSVNYYHPELDKIATSALLLDRAQTEVGLYYAGLSAEKYQYRLHYGSDKFPSYLDGSHDDQKDASKIIKKYGLAPPGQKRYNYKKKMMRKVAKELRQNWEAVTIVAHALFRKKRISFLTLKELLITQTTDKDFWKERFKDISQYYENENSLTEQDFVSLISIK